MFPTDRHDTSGFPFRPATHRGSVPGGRSHRGSRRV